MVFFGIPSVHGNQCAVVEVPSLLSAIREQFPQSVRNAIDVRAMPDAMRQLAPHNKMIAAKVVMARIAIMRALNAVHTAMPIRTGFVRLLKLHAVRCDGDDLRNMDRHVLKNKVG
jgi:hypothetical protein